MTGRIEVIVGSMFSGKSEELIRRVKRALYAKQKVQVFKPKRDDRYAKRKVVTHEQLAIKATPVKGCKELRTAVLEDTEVVAIDEAQFFTPKIVKLADDLANKGYRVILAGLDQDFQGTPFGAMPELMAIAEDVTKVRAVCMVCGKEASRTQRLNPSTKRVQLGGVENYEARCRACHRP